MVFQLFKPFLKDKLKSRIIFHGTDRDSLHQYISPKCLPKQYGGTLSFPLVTGSQWYELLLLCDKEYEGLYYIFWNFKKSIFFNLCFIFISAINSYGYKNNNNNNNNEKNGKKGKAWSVNSRRLEEKENGKVEN